MFWKILFQAVLRIALIVLCLYAGHRFLADAVWSDALDHITAVPPIHIGLALLCGLASYAALIGYDVLACRALGQKLKLRDIALASALANAISNMLGFALFSGGAVRLRIYGALGVPAATVAKISLFCTATFLAGLTLTAGFGLAQGGDLFGQLTSLSGPVISVVGCGLLILCLAFPVLALFCRRIRWRGRSINLPTAPLLWSQYGVGLIDIAATGGVLFWLLPVDVSVDYFFFITLFSAAIWLGLISHMPGGLGVFEAVMLAGTAHHVPSSSMLGALLLYRVFYYGLPFLLAATALVASEARQTVGHLTGMVRLPIRVLQRLPDYFLPGLLAGLIAVAGLVLLASGATPAVTERLQVLADYLPIGLIEGSHLFSSLAGLGLLIIARGVYQRFDSAYAVTLVLLVAGIVLSLTKGFDYEEAILLSILLPLVVLSRRMFYRPSRFGMLDVGWSWWLFIAVSIGTTIWLVFFSYKHVEYNNYLWWQIAIDDEGDASRSLRSILLVCSIALALTLHQLFRPAKLGISKPTQAEIDDVAEIVGSAPDTVANLALTGDKYLLFSEERDAFIMFGQTWRSLVAMGGPVGNPERYDALIWRFHELADLHCKRVAFYQVRSDELPLYIDAGFQFARLGEEALVSLQDFSLDGGRYKNLRQSMMKGERDGLTFSIVPLADVASIEPDLRRVSNLWLNEKQADEKRFSVGAYSRDYICRFPVAVVYRAGEIVAFANIWAGGKTELSVDLMRFVPGERYAMDILFARLMSWGKMEGYSYFNLGMAPLAGFNSHRLAPSWTKMGAFIFSHGEHWYNFQGVHAFKEKFRPEWRPRYLAYSGGSSLLLLLDIAILIAGSFRRLFSK